MMLIVSLGFLACIILKDPLCIFCFSYRNFNINTSNNEFIRKKFKYLQDIIKNNSNYVCYFKSNKYRFNNSFKKYK